MVAAISLCVLLALLGSLTSAAARERQQTNPTPNAITPCSVLDEGPCTPSYCGVFGPWPCFPETNYPIGQNLQVTVESNPRPQDAGKYQKPDHDLNTLGDLFAALRSCWSPPQQADGRAGMQMSVRFSFKRDGAIIAPPRVTFASAGAPADIRDRYQQAIQASLDRCVPLKFTPGLGGAIAGRPIAIRYVDNRDFGAPSTDR